MSKNTGTSELINYFDLGVNGDVGIAGSLDINTIANATTDTDTFLVSDTGIIKYRTGAQLLSDIGAAPAVAGGYVPYTGATTNVDLGVYNLTASAIIANGSGSNSGIVHLESNAIHSLVNGYGSIASGTTNQFNLYQTTGAGVFRGAILSLNSITEFATRTFTLPNTDGTIALTSQIPANAVGGTGTTNTLSKFTASTTIGNSSITDDGTIVSILNSSFTDVLRVGSTTRFLYFYPDSGSVNIMTGAGFTGSGITFAGFSNYLDFNTNSLTRMRLTTAGNLVLGPNPFTDSGARFQVSGTATVSGNVGIGTSGSSDLGARLNVRNEDAANNPTLVLFKNISSGSAEDIFRVQSWNGAFNTVASIRANGSANFLSSVSATSLRSSTVGTFGFNTASNGEFQMYAEATAGLVIAGRGATYDMVIANKNGADTIRIPTGTTNVNFVGNVGIGMSSPSYPLHISSSIQDFTAAIINTNVSDNAGLLIKAGVNTGNSVLRVQKGNGSDLFLVDAGGNVGINTNNPDGQLSGTKGLSIVHATNAAVGLSNGTNHWLNYLSGTTYRIWNNSVSEVMTLTYSGNVLIGTTTDTGQRLQVNGITYSTNYISGTQGLNVSGYGFLTQTISGQMTVLGHNISASSSVANQVNVVNGGWYSSMIRMYYSEGITFHTSTTVYSAGAVYPMDTTTERVRIQTDGQVRFQSSIILTNGQINSLTSGGSGQSMYLNFGGNGAIYAGSSYTVLYAGSDERIKTEINHSQSTLTKILNLIPRTFKYKERPEVTNYGFIAQEVEAVMPELVRTSEGITMCLDEQIENQKSVESYGLAWASILVKAIQEQQQQIQELKNKLS